MSDLHLDAALALSARLLASVKVAEESANLQRRTVGAVLRKTRRQLHGLRRDLAKALLEASRLSRDAGLDDQALELVRQYAEQDHLVNQLELEASAHRELWQAEELKSQDELGR